MVLVQPDATVRFPRNGEGIYVPAPPGTPLSLTLSGNEITDAVRAAGLSGDGLSPEGSVGVWEATTNLVANGGFETNTNGWAATGGTSISRVTSHAKFGAASLSVDVDGAAGNQGATSDLSLTASVTYTVSVWVKCATGGVSSRLWMRLVGVNKAQTVFTSSTSWQKVSLTFTADTTATWTIQVGNNAAAAETYYIDGVQLEPQPLATPYEETDGATATRNAARVRVTSPGAVIDKDQGWAAMRVRTRGTEPLGGTGYCRAMEISTSPGRYGIQYDEANNRWYFQQIDSASVQHNVTINRAMADETITLIMAWTAAIVAGSINGSAFSSTAAGTSAVFSSDLYIGDSVLGGQQANLDFFWFACGTGTLTDADAAAIHANGNPDPPKALFPTAAAVKLIWNAITNQARQYA